MRWPFVVDGRRSVASLGAGTGAVGGTHSTGCRVRFRIPFGRGRRPPVLAPVACARIGTTGAPPLSQERASVYARGPPLRCCSGSSLVVAAPDRVPVN
jgi:hypothetical protein